MNRDTRSPSLSISGTIHQLPIPAACLDHQCRVIIYNEAAQKQLGWDDRVLGTPCRELICKQEPASCPAEDGYGLSGICRNNNCQGILIPVMETPEEATRYLCLLDTAENNEKPDTGTSESHRRCCRNSPELETIFQTSPLAMALVRERHIVRCNPSFCRLFGYDISELSGCSTRIFFISEEEYQALGREAYPLMAQGETYSGIWSMKKKDGRRIHMKLIGSQVAGSISDRASVWILEDITSQLVLEDALRESEERFQTMAEMAPDAFVVLDGNGNVTYWNSRAESIFGYSRDEIIGRNMHALLVPSEYMQAYKRSFHQTMASGHSRLSGSPREFTAYHRDGTAVEVEVSFSLMEMRGQRYSLGVIRDISERKKMEEEQARLEQKIQQAQKLESLGVLAGGIAHDFNNLLVGILGYADLSLLKLPKEAPVWDNILAIKTAAQRASELTNQMLAYSGKGSFLVEQIDLSALVEEMTHLLQTVIAKNAVLKFSLAVNLPPVKVDVTQVRQVVMNLITNASEAIEDKSGVITLSTGIMEADLDYLSGSCFDEGLEAGYYVYFEVSDTGKGMDKVTKSKIFDPFFTTKFSGRGLGLAAVLGIVRSHGGTIKVYSEPGQGTTFKVLFPSADKHPDMQTKRPRESSSYRRYEGRTVLLVDDEETVRAVGKMMLEELGLTVLTAEDGREGVEVFRLRREEIDLVILDMMMPHMGGEEAFRELRRLDTEVRVILTSGYNEHEATDRFSGKGLAGFLQKPFILADLQAMLGRCFGA